MIPDGGALLLLLLLGGVVTVDGTSLGQFMVSRPLVAASLAGWIAGAPEQGALLGLLLEAFHLTVLPVGAARYPEGGPAAVAAAGVYATAVPASAPGMWSILLPVVALALLWEWVAGLTVQGLRQLNVRLSPPPQAVSLRPERLERRHLLAVAVDFARGVLLAGAGIALFAAVLALPAGLLPGPGIARLALGAALAASLGAALRMFGRERARLFLVGALGGVLLLLLRR